MNSHAWVLLTTRSGQDVNNPCPNDLRRAIAELDMVSQAARGESQEAWLRCGSEGGPVYHLGLGSDGSACFSEFSDAEADDPVVELEKRVTPEQALDLCVLLAGGSVDAVKERLGPPT